MADRDILELENAEEFADGVDMDHEFGDESISKLKEKAKRRHKEMVEEQSEAEFEEEKS